MPKLVEEAMLLLVPKQAEKKPHFSIVIGASPKAWKLGQRESEIYIQCLDFKRNLAQSEYKNCTKASIMPTIFRGDNK